MLVLLVALPAGRSWGYVEELFPAQPTPAGYPTIQTQLLSRDGTTAFYNIAPPSSSTFTRQSLALGSGVVSPAPVHAAIAAYSSSPIVTANGRFHAFSAIAAIVGADTNGVADA